jgi:hypothetical protein
MGLNLVVFGTLIAVVAVNTTEQLGAVTGILGSIGGYLFGSRESRGLRSRKGATKVDSREAADESLTQQ